MSPAPFKSTCSVYSQPRSTAVALGVLTKNVSGAPRCARESCLSTATSDVRVRAPRRAAGACSDRLRPGRFRRLRCGRRETPSVSSQSPTRSRPLGLLAAGTNAINHGRTSKRLHGPAAAEPSERIPSNCGRKQHGSRSRKPADEPHASVEPARLTVRKLGRLPTMTQLTQQRLETHDLRIRLAGTVPEIRALVGLGLLHRSSFSRSIVMPRCRLTRTDAGVSPVRSRDFGTRQAFNQPQDKRLTICGTEGFESTSSTPSASARDEVLPAVGQVVRQAPPNRPTDDENPWRDFSRSSSASRQRRPDPAAIRADSTPTGRRPARGPRHRSWVRGRAARHESRARSAHTRR